MSDISYLLPHNVFITTPTPWFQYYYSHFAKVNKMKGSEGTFCHHARQWQSQNLNVYFCPLYHDVLPQWFNPILHWWKKWNSGRQMSSTVPVEIQLGRTGSVPVSKYLYMGFPDSKLGNKDTKLRKEKKFEIVIYFCWSANKTFSKSMGKIIIDVFSGWIHEILMCFLYIMM